MSAPRLTMRLLGRPALWLDGDELELPQPKILALLAYLAVQGGPCPRDLLAELLWGAGRSKNLRMALYKARALPSADAWLSADDTVELRVDTDLASLEVCLAQSTFGDVERWLPELPAVLLEGVDGGTDAYEQWLEEERGRVAVVIRDVLAGAAQAAERHGDLDAALLHARRLVRLDAFDEAAHRMTMRLEHGRGHTEAALWHFDGFRRRLQEEFGTEPEPATLALVHEIERGLHGTSERAQRFDREADVWFRPDLLVGREALLDEVATALGKGGWVQLHGFAGIGKTAVAAELSARWLADGGGSVLWVTAAGDDAEALADTLARALDEGAGKQAVAERGGSAAGLVARAKDKGATLRTLLSSAGIALVVLDDARNPYVLSRALEAMPATVAVLVTARRRYGGLARVTIDSLTPDDGQSLLEHHAGRGLGQSGAALTERLGAHPFALRVAGVRLHRSDVTIDTILDEIELALDTLRVPRDEAEPGRENVVALLDASLQAVTDEAYEAFWVVGGLFAPSVTAALLARLVRRPLEEAEEALFELASWALAERIAEPGRDGVRYRLHDLAFTHARHNRSVRTPTVIAACHAYAVEAAADLAALDAEISNLIAAAAEAARGRHPEAFIGIVRALAIDGPYLETRGPTPRALALLALAAERSEAQGEVRTAHYLWSKLGNAQRERSADFGAALESYERALRLAKALEDRDREAILTCITGVTLVYLQRPGAEQRLARALELARDHGQPATLLHVLQNLGGVAGLQGDIEAALRYSQEAVEVARTLLHTQGPAPAGAALVYALLNLAEALRDLGRLSDAESPLEEAHELAQQLDHTLLEGFACQALGELHHAAGAHDKARDFLLEAHDLYRRSRAGIELAKLDRRLVELGLGEETSS